MSNFIAIKSKATIVKMLNDEIEDSHNTTLSEKEFDDVKLLGRIYEAIDIIYKLEKQKRKLVIKYNKRQKKGDELNI